MNLISVTFSGRDNSIPRAQYEKKRKSNWASKCRLECWLKVQKTSLFSQVIFSFRYNNGKGIEHWNDVIVKWEKHVDPPLLWWDLVSPKSGFPVLDVLKKCQRVTFHNNIVFCPQASLIMQVIFDFTPAKFFKWSRWKRSRTITWYHPMLINQINYLLANITKIHLSTKPIV